MTEAKDMRRTYGNKVRVYFYSVLALSAILAVLRLITLIFNYDYVIGYYDDGFLVSAMNAMTVLGCAWALSAFFLLPRTCSRQDVCPRSGMVALYFSAFVFLADAVYSFAGMIGSSEFFDPFSNPHATQTDKIMVIMAILGAFAALASAICFFRRASGMPARGIDVGFGFLPMLRMLSGVFSVYFDMEVPMNSPHKMLIEWALIASMLFLLQENRFFAPVLKRPRAYLSFGLLAMLLTAAAGFGGLFSYFSGLLPQGRFCVESLICLTMFIHISASLHSYVKQLAPAETEESAEESAAGE